MQERDRTYRSGESTFTPGRDDADEMMQESASQAADKAREQAHQARERAASAVDRAAAEIRERAQRQDGKTAEIGVKVADRLESTSDYLEQHDANEMLDDIEKYVRNHPMQAVGAAAVGGFVLARILR
jgi:ElaB/YqjD/DUF883 family membrane-anchored ribosome-binding protein